LPSCRHSRSNLVRSRKLAKRGATLRCSRSADHSPHSGASGPTRRALYASFGHFGGLLPGGGTGLAGRSQAGALRPADQLQDLRALRAGAERCAVLGGFGGLLRFRLLGRLRFVLGGFLALETLFSGRRLSSTLSSAWGWWPGPWWWRSRWCWLRWSCSFVESSLRVWCTTIHHSGSTRKQGNSTGKFAIQSDDGSASSRCCP
jgi:hypothetical protein